MKGLVIKGAPEGYSFVERIVSLIRTNTESVTNHIAECWKVLLADSNFSKDNKFIITPFNKQRLFSIVFPNMLMQYNELAGASSSEEQQKRLAVIIKILLPLCQSSPYALYKDHSSALVPITVSSLGVADSDVREISLSMIFNVLVKNPENYQPQFFNLLTSVAGAVGDKVHELSPTGKKISLAILSLLVFLMGKEVTGPHKDEML